MKPHSYYIYILTNKYNSVFYIGVTSNLEKRIHEHHHKVTSGFTAKYNIGKLVYFEETDDINAAIAREKQIKGGSRKKKVELVRSMNFGFRDLLAGDCGVYPE